MGRGGLLLLLLFAACAHQRQLNLLERETLRFRAENETIRAEDLEQRYADQKRKADALSAELLTLERDRDRLYGRYDVLRGEVVRLEREVQLAGERHGALTQATDAAKALVKRLEEELAKERQAIEALRQRLDAARTEHAALASPPAEKPAAE
jgi:chromosome segregation ATPase